MMLGMNQEELELVPSTEERLHLTRNARRLLMIEVSKLSEHHKRILVMHQDRVDNLIDQFEVLLGMALRSSLGSQMRDSQVIFEMSRTLMRELKETCGSG
jgi:hypothetical protein